MSKAERPAAEHVASGTDASLRTLRPIEQKLIALSRKIGYGCLRNLAVHDGQLVLLPQTRARRKYRLGKPEQGRHTQPLPADFKLKAHHLDLIARLRRIRSGRIVSIEVQDGLPVDLTIEEDVAV